MDTPKVVFIKTPVLRQDRVDRFTVQLDAIKTLIMINFMIMIKKEITLLKQKKCEGDNHSDDNDDKNIKLFNLLMSFLQQENSLIKSELNKKQNITEKC